MHYFPFILPSFAYVYRYCTYFFHLLVVIIFSSSFLLILFPTCLHFNYFPAKCRLSHRIPALFPLCTIYFSFFSNFSTFFPIFNFHGNALLVSGREVYGIFQTTVGKQRYKLWNKRINLKIVTFSFLHSFQTALDATCPYFTNDTNSFPNFVGFFSSPGRSLLILQCYEQLYSQQGRSRIELSPAVLQRRLLVLFNTYYRHALSDAAAGASGGMATEQKPLHVPPNHWSPLPGGWWAFTLFHVAWLYSLLFSAHDVRYVDMDIRSQNIPPFPSHPLGVPYWLFPQDLKRGERKN